MKVDFCFIIVDNHLNLNYYYLQISVFSTVTTCCNLFLRIGGSDGVISVKGYVVSSSIIQSEIFNFDFDFNFFPLPYYQPYDALN